MGTQGEGRQSTREHTRKAAVPEVRQSACESTGKDVIVGILEKVAMLYLGEDSGLWHTGEVMIPRGRHFLRAHEGKQQYPGEDSGRGTLRKVAVPGGRQCPWAHTGRG